MTEKVREILGRHASVIIAGARRTVRESRSPFGPNLAPNSVTIAGCEFITVKYDAQYTLYRGYYSLTASFRAYKSAVT